MKKIFGFYKQKFMVAVVVYVGTFFKKMFVLQLSCTIFIELLVAVAVGFYVVEPSKWSWIFMGMT